MLFWAHKLREPICWYISVINDESLFSLSLGYREWWYMEYLLQLLHEFYAFIKSLLKQNSVTIYKASIIYFNWFLLWLHLTDMSWKAYMIYNTLFNHINDCQHDLINKSWSWKKKLYQGLKAACKKLSYYYSKIYSFQDIIYVISIILDPCQKFSVFHGISWKDATTGVSWDIYYKYVLKKVYDYYSDWYPTTEKATHLSMKLNPINIAIHKSKYWRYNQQFSSSNNQSPYNRYSELQKYLENEYKYFINLFSLLLCAIILPWLLSSNFTIRLSTWHPWLVVR